MSARRGNHGAVVMHCSCRLPACSGSARTSVPMRTLRHRIAGRGLRPPSSEDERHPHAQRRGNVMSVEPVGGPQLPQERRIVTAIPGPESVALHARKTASVAAGGRYDAPRLRHRRGRGSRRRRRRQLADRLRLRHRRHDGRQQRAARRRGRRRAGRGVHPHLLHDHAVRRLRPGRGGAQPAHAGRLREEVGALQLRRRGGRERRQDRPAVHQAAGGGRRSTTPTTGGPT